MIQAMESIRRSVVVAVPQERAFEVFTSGMTGWWPVEVRFVPEGPDRTRVELEHRDLDRFGPDAERMHETFNAPGAWDSTLAAFAAGVDGCAS
jgi:hypothetical protein